MSNNKSLNDSAWEQIFDKYDVLNYIDINGSFSISAKQIKEFREPRLMAKFDHTINLPKIFAENKLSILPITRGDYIISHFKAYHEFEPTNSDLIKVSLPPHIQSLAINNITSESFALNCAIATGIIEDFTEDENIIPTVSGRMASGEFKFQIMNTQNKEYEEVNVFNSQIEIDSAYEGVKYLSIFEAKRDLSDDFLIRQLYYPYRTWKNRIGKEIKPIFLVYSNGIYYLYQYKFENPQDYGSLILVKQKNYTIEEDTIINVQDIQELLKSSVFVAEPKIPFPQANSFNRVVNLCELLEENPMSKSKIAENYDFDSRQSDYYVNALRYLGLSEKTREDRTSIYCLNTKGKSVLRKNYKQRQLTFCSLILSHKVFADVLKIYFEHGVMPDNNEIVKLMKQANLYGIDKESTFGRRASSIRGWIEWIVGLINE